jgi:hypothetical protein
MGAKPKKTGSAARVPAKKTRAPARRVPVRRASTKGGRSGVRETTVDAYVAALSGPLAEVAVRLRHLVMGAAPSAAESIKWGQPVYEDNGPFCYFKANTGHITFGFWRGTELDDPDERLQGDGDRMKHLALRSIDDVDDEAIGRWVRQAVDLNWRLGSPTRMGSQAEAAEAPVAVEVADRGGEEAATRPIEPVGQWQRPGDDAVDVDVDDADDARYSDATPTRRIEATQPLETLVDDDSFQPVWKDDDR